MKRKFIYFLSIIGIILSLLTVQSHYAPDDGFCLSGGGCDIVNKSQYSEFFGIPLGFFGSLWFLAYMFSNKINRKYLSIAGLAGIAYLIYIELAVLYTICSTCTAIHALILILIVDSFSGFSKNHSTKIQNFK